MLRTDKLDHKILNCGLFHVLMPFVFSFNAKLEIHMLYKQRNHCLCARFDVGYSGQQNVYMCALF